MMWHRGLMGPGMMGHGGMMGRVPTKMASSLWRRCRLSCRGPGDRFRSSRGRGKGIASAARGRVSPAPAEQSVSALVNGPNGATTLFHHHRTNGL
jgi:hypothetical protein